MFKFHRNFLLFIFISLLFNISYTIYLGQIDTDENSSFCLNDSEGNYSTFFVVNKSEDIAFKVVGNCIHYFSFKNTTYGKKYIDILFVNCYNPFDLTTCQSSGKYDPNFKSIEKRYYFLVNKSYSLKLEYNKTGKIYNVQKIYLFIKKKSNGKSNFNLSNLTISPISGIKSYNLFKIKNGYLIEFIPIIENRYDVNFKIIRNGFEEIKFNLSINIYPTTFGKINNIKKGLLVIPSYLQGFYSLINLIL